MDKKYLIVFIVAVVAAGGFFIFKNHKNEQDLKTHETKQYKRLIQTAQKSPYAGLIHLGKALNKYKQEKGAYPAKLAVLYPDYIPSKAFLTDIKWDYKRNGQDFYLKKTLQTKNNKVLTAAIDSDLKPIQGSMVASIKKPKRSTTTAKSKPVAKISATSITLASEKKADMVAEIGTPAAAAGSLKPNLVPKMSLKVKPVAHEIDPVLTKELNEKEQYITRVKGNFLVWKNDDGTLGFGNIQYPNSEKMTIYDDGKWVQIHRRKSKPETGVATRKVQEEKAARKDGLIASESG